MGGCHSELEHKEGEPNSLEDSKMSTGSNLSFAEGKEPPSFQELCSRQQDLFVRSDALKSAVVQQTKRRSFRSELADIVLKGPKRHVQPPEDESEVIEDVGKPGPSTPRVKLSYRRPTLDDNTTPEMKDVVNKYFDTLEELKKFVVSDEIYLDRKAPSVEGKAGDGEHDLGEEDGSGADERTPAEPNTEAENGVVVDPVDLLAPIPAVENLSASDQNTEHLADMFEEESTSPKTTRAKRKMEKSRKTKKTKRAFSCFSSENCE